MKRVIVAQGFSSTDLRMDLEEKLQAQRKGEQVVGTAMTSVVEPDPDRLRIIHTALVIIQEGED